MRLLLIIAVIWLLGTCRSALPEVPQNSEWTAWSNVAAGYALELPDVYVADVEDCENALFFRWDGRVPVKLYLTDVESAIERGGLWLALDFRSEGELNHVNQRVLSSFTLLSRQGTD